MRNTFPALSISFSSQNIRAFERQQFDVSLPMKAVSTQKIPKNSQARIFKILDYAESKRYASPPPIEYAYF